MLGVFHAACLVHNAIRSIPLPLTRIVGSVRTLILERAIRAASGIERLDDELLAHASLSRRALRDLLRQLDTSIRRQDCTQPKSLAEIRACCPQADLTTLARCS